MDEHISVLEKQLCLVLNARWIPIGCLSIKKAVVALSGGLGDEHPAMALDIEMGVDENGDDVVINARPVKWEEWVGLKIRDCDLYIQTNRSKIRAPTVIISTGYAKVPMHRPRLSLGNIAERDNYTCQYSGRKLSRKELSIDHIHPKSRGGKEIWENLVLADKKINTMKADRFPHEVGLKLIRQPKAPPLLPVSTTIRESRHNTWKPFLFV